MKKISCIYFLFLFCSCSTTNNIFGLYRNKFASQGFFVSSIQLNIDSSFEYRFAGDMQNDRGFGSYSFIGRKIILKYVPSQFDTFSMAYTAKKSIFKNIDGIIKLVGDTTYQVATNQYLEDKVKRRPKNFYYKNDKLLSVKDDGTLYNGKDFVYSSRKKFFLFGTKYFYRKNPLRKVEAAHK